MKRRWPQIRCWVRDFGPIREGGFDLAPLTVFIGPNGSGKTYAATLAYLWAKALQLVRNEGFWDLYNLLLNSAIEGSADSIVVPDMLSAPSKQDAYRRTLRKIAHRSTSFLQEQLLRYFGRESPESLMRKGGENLRVSFEWWSTKETSLSLEGEWRREEGWRWERGGFDEIRLILPHPSGPRRKRLNFLGPDHTYLALRDALGFPPDVFYLPAARAGLLQGWRVLAAMAIRVVRKEIGLRRIEATPYAGVAGDFLLTIAEGPPRAFWWEEPEMWEISHPDPGRERVTRFLEEEILRGYVDWRSQEDPELLLVQRDMRLPLTAISSGLAELAPLDLLLRRQIIGPGDWLIVEEPEAHLHPENQRRIATLMVRLVRWGVRVLCTTHSDIILHQLSNHLLFGEALEKGYRPEGFDPEWDRLGYDEVGVYLFRLEEDGAVVEPVVPEPGFGIPEDEFVRVAEALGSQTYDLLDLIGTE